MTPRVVSLFAGVGGFDLGFERVGFEIVAHVEKDANCRKLLAAKFPDAEVFEDVCDVHSKEYLDDSVRKWFTVETQHDELMAGKLKKLTQEQADECVRLYDGGLSLGDISGYFSVSRQAMWDLLRRRTTLRPQKRIGDENHFHRGGKTADAKANDICERAIEKGILIRPPLCEDCGGHGKKFKDGRAPIQAHHCDYNKPLEVLWLCQECHHKWHKKNTPKRKEVLQEIPKCDVIVAGFP
jgi:hypothetical protein